MKILIKNIGLMQDGKVTEHKNIAVEDKYIKEFPENPKEEEYDEIIDGHDMLAMPGLVETSTNLASVKFEGDDRIVVTTSQRSSVESAKVYASQMIESVFALAGAEVSHSEGYPGWAPNPQSKLLEITVASYEKLFGVKPKVRAIHAGLECGLFLEKYPHLEMVSFGPTLRGVHSPDERLEIATVPKFWDLLADILKKVE